MFCILLSCIIVILGLSNEAVSCGEHEWVCYVEPRQAKFTNVSQNLRCYNPNVEHCIDDWVCARNLNARCGDVCYDTNTHVCHTPGYHLCHIGAKGYCQATGGCFDDNFYYCDPKRGLIPRHAHPGLPPATPVPNNTAYRPVHTPIPSHPPVTQPVAAPGSYTYTYYSR